MNPAMLRALDKDLDALLQISPPAKTVNQWTHQPNLPTGEVAGTELYIAECRKKSVNNFAVLSPAQRRDVTI